MPGRHAPQAASPAARDARAGSRRRQAAQNSAAPQNQSPVQTRTLKRDHPVRKAFVSTGAMLVALGLAATMAIPAVSAAAAKSPPASAVQADLVASGGLAQKLTVSDSAKAQTVVRDGSFVLYQAAYLTAMGVYAGGASPASPLSVGRTMVINPPSPSLSGEAVVQYAEQFVGMVPYIIGGDSPSTGFSCDTFVRYVYAQFGIVLHGDAVVEASMGTIVPKEQALPGDFVYYSHQHIGGNPVYVRPPGR
jgi:cell wall-associated NlpC family hydrolase